MRHDLHLVGRVLALEVGLHPVLLLLDLDSIPVGGGRAQQPDPAAAAADREDPGFAPPGVDRGTGRRRRGARCGRGRAVVRAVARAGGRGMGRTRGRAVGVTVRRRARRVGRRRRLGAAARGRGRRARGCARGPGRGTRGVLMGRSPNAVWRRRWCRHGVLGHCWSGRVGQNAAAGRVDDLPGDQGDNCHGAGPDRDQDHCRTHLHRAPPRRGRDKGDRGW